MPASPELFPRSLPRFPAAGREQPALWVRRLVVWPDRERPPIRDVRLRRGLNIVWSPDKRPDGTADIGHGAGKTLFCRLIRYCLGEATFASAEVEDRIQRAFPEGVVGAEVVVGGVAWMVVRPIGHVGPETASTERTLEELRALHERDGLGPYLDALQEAVVPASARPLYPDTNGHNAWLYVLASVSRDQECRADGLLQWRHRDSHARSPVRLPDVGDEQRLQALRALLAGLSQDEFTLRAQRAVATKERVELERVTASLERELERSRAEVARLLSVPDGEVRADELSLGNLRRLAGEAVRAAARREALARDPELEAEERRESALSADAAALKADVEAGAARLALIRARCVQLDALRVPTSQRVRDAKHPKCPMTGTPVDKVKAEGCSIALPDPGMPREELRQIEADLAEAQRELAEAEPVHRERESRLAAAATELKAVRASIERRTTHFARIAAEADLAARNAWTARARIDLFEQRHDELTKAATAVGKAREKDEDFKKRITEAREAQMAAFDTVGLWFDWIARMLFGTAASGSVALDGTGLRVAVEANSIDGSTAVESVKVAAFDIAAMLAAASGRGAGPRFLMHDSPREADLSLAIYHRLIGLLREREGDGEPAFQYIVTTTTEPPGELQQEPWDVLRLSASVDGERLLGKAL